MANQTVHLPSATASLEEASDAQTAEEQLEFLGNAIIKAIAYLCVSVLPQCG